MPTVPRGLFRAFRGADAPRRRSRVVAGVVLAVVAGLPAMETLFAEGPAVEVELGDGGVTAGTLARIDAAGVHLEASSAGGPAATLPADRVRIVRRNGGLIGQQGRVVVELLDGSTVSGDDFAWDGKASAALIRPEGRGEIPVGSVRSVEWRDGEAAGTPSRWLTAVPEGIGGDLVVVGTDDSHEFVECAITGVSADAVTVVLDDETIPVKRSRVIGLRWLRDQSASAEAAAARAVVAVAGGEIRGSRLEWSPEACVIDDAIRLPPGLFVGVDYAAGRSLSLTGLTAEKVEVEPWLGSLGQLGSLGRKDGQKEKDSQKDFQKDGLAAFFAPRILPGRGTEAGASPRPDASALVPAIILRPRTVSVWRLPPDSRRFRARIAAEAGAQSADAVVVSVAVDDRRLFQRQVGGLPRTSPGAGTDDEGDQAAGLPIDVDLAAGRRLTVTVDFAEGGMGGAVRLIRPVIER